MDKNWDLIVIGAGPAGMSAAIEAGAQGLEVLMLDRQPEPGGQIYRGAGSAAPEKVKALGADYTRGRKLIDEFKKASANLITEAEVWHLSTGRVCYTSKGRSHCAPGKEILVATGGMERPVPVSGRPLYAAHGINLWLGMLLKSRCYFGSRDIFIKKTAANSAYPLSPSPENALLQAQRCCCTRA